MTRDKVVGRGFWNLEIIRHGAIIKRVRHRNAMTDGGIHHMLDATFNEASQNANWYAGLINNSGFTAVNPTTDTMASHSGWTELVSYNEATRPEWEADAAASKSITNTTLMVFNMNATATVKGAFIASANDKSGTTGILLSVFTLPSNLSVQNGDIVRATYTLEVENAT